jgi:hypothetical protein
MVVKYIKAPEKAAQAETSGQDTNTPKKRKRPPTASDGSGIKRRGFASMPPERLKEISKKGGAGASPEKRTFSVNRKLAKAAAKIRNKSRDNQQA